MEITNPYTLSRPQKCELKLHKQVYSCKGCTFAGGIGMERKTVSKCIELPNGKHRVAMRTEYVINDEGCCKVKR